MRAAESRMCILDQDRLILKTLRQIHTNFFLTDLRIVKPYTAGRAARARVQWYMVSLCADQ